MDIKEIALKAGLANFDSYQDDGKTLMVAEFDVTDQVIRTVESAVAEIAKQNEPVAWWNGKETAFFEHETDGPVGEVKIPLYTIPPTAEQIANETAEAIAEYCRNQDHYCLATEIESGAWKEFKNV